MMRSDQNTPLPARLNSHRDADALQIWLVAACFAMLALFAPQAASFNSDMCAADRFGEDLVCTANDVSITGMAVVGDTTSCVGGTNVTLDLKMTVNFAVPDRWDIGIFISSDGRDPQNLSPAPPGIASKCSVSVLPTASPFLNLDGGANGDTCGDGNGSIGGGTGTGIHYMPNVTVPCQSLPGASGNLYIPFVVSWDNQETKANGTGGSICRSNQDPVPNTKSKCNAPTVIQGSVSVVVMPSITNTDGISTIFSGDGTNYTVTVSNTTGVSLSSALFKDPAVSGITVTNVGCAASAGTSCPAGNSATLIAGMQGAGLTLPAMAANSTITFTIAATLTGSPSDTRTNTASVSVGSQVNSASDTDIIVGTIAILPSTLAQNGDPNATVIYSYKVYNKGASADTISLSVASSKGWVVTRSPTSVNVAAGGSADVTVTVKIPNGTVIGTVDTTTLTAVSGINPSKTATATAVTSVTAVLTLTPSNTGAGGAGSYVYYNHRVQNNASGSKSVSLTPTLSACAGVWTSALFETDKTTALSSPVTLGANGGYKDFVLKIGIPTGAANGSTCTASLAAAYTSGTASTATVTDVTTVKNLVLYEDPGYTTEQSTYPAGNNVYGKTYGLTNGTPYYYKWLNPSGTVMQTSATTSNLVTLPDTYSIPGSGPLGTWTVQVWNATTNTIFDQTNFYVGPDHLKASYTGANPPINTETVINLALHDKSNHVVPFDATPNLVKGGAAEDPLFITVTVSGSAEIVATTLSNASIVGQTVTGKLSNTTGLATVTIRNAVAETISVTPASYLGKLYGSPVRDEAATVTFVGASLDHYAIDYPLGNPGVTCEALAVRITGHKADDTAVAPATATQITLSTSPATGGWALKSGNGSFTGGDKYSFDGTETSAEFWLTQTTPLADINVGVTDGSKTDKDGNATEDPKAQFVDTAFKYYACTGAVPATCSEVSINNQIAGKGSNLAPNAQNLYLRSVKMNPTTGACTGGLVGSQVVQLAYECNNPATCYGSNLLAINASGNAITIPRNDSGGVSAATGTYSASSGVCSSVVCMNFTTDGYAPFNLGYSDVGQITLHAKKLVTAGTGTPPSRAATIYGASNAFIVKPYGFTVTNVVRTSDSAANPAAADASGTAFMAAGDTFSATISAISTANSVTPSFGRESTAEGVTLTHSLVSPAGGAAGTLGGTTIIPGASFQSGTKGVAVVTDLTWGEVGVITLKASNANYLANGLGACSLQTVGEACQGSFGDSSNIGRFIPHHFELTAGTLTAADATGGYSYMDQPFGLTFTLTAKNAFTCPPAPNCTTSNYATTAVAASNYAKLDPTNPALWPQSTLGTNSSFGLGARDGASKLSDRLAVVGTPSCSTSNCWGSGIATVTANLKFSRPDTSASVVPTTAWGPFNALDIGVAPQDADGVKLSASALNLDADSNTINERQKMSAQTKVRFGRLRLINSYGSELLDSRVEVRADYWDGSRWTTNTLDKATTFGSGNVFISNAGGLAPTAKSITQFSSGSGGVGFITFNKTSVVGSFDVALNLNASGSDSSCNPSHGGDAAKMPWLQGFWGATTVCKDAGSVAIPAYQQDPSARVKLGSPKAPYIYLRERY